MDTTICPECGVIAEVLWRDVVESTNGPVEHAQIRCVERHVFLLPVATLAATSGGLARRARPRPPVALRGDARRP